MKSTTNRPARRAAATRRLVCTRAFPALNAPFHAFQTAQRGLQEEVVVEGLLHVTAVQAGSCMQRFGSIEDLTAPPLWPSTATLTDAANSSKVADLGSCLATPPDPEEEEEAQRPVVRQTTTNPTSSASRASRTVASLQADQLAQFGAQVYPADVLEASASIRRRRRRAIIKALRAGRDTTRAFLQASYAALATALTSLDDAACSSNAE